MKPEIMADYVAVYELMPGFEITVAPEDGQLHVQATGQPKFPVFAESETKFFLKVWTPKSHSFETNRAT